ncbi:MAG: 30S ribosomal protein S8 [Candidatus Dojkabacteria bacterium]|nr:30S ribosomal protein S8 [Candidatus Dojkabacteria bacterium]
MVTDTIGDYLTRIRNAQLRKKKVVSVPSSKILKAMSQILKEEGFIMDFEETGEKTDIQKSLKLTLKYSNDDKAAISGLKRISKPGVRTYVGYRNIPKVLGGFGITILTTSKGLMTGSRAKEMKIGGEYLCKVW